MLSPEPKRNHDLDGFEEQPESAEEASEEESEVEGYQN